MKKKTVLSIFAAVASLCLLIGLSFATHTAAFAADEAITFDSGAAIRIDPSRENNTSGIRFSANVPSSLAEKEVGMIVVPAYILDKVNDNYAEYFESRGVALSEISTVFNAEQKQSGNVKGSIVGIRDENFNLEYQAVCYYKEGDRYVYSAKSDKRSIAFVADKSYANLTGESDVAKRAEVIRIIAKSVETSLDAYMYEGQKLNLAEQLSRLEKGGVTLAGDGSVLSADGNSVTAVAVGSGSVTVSGYGGDLEVTKSVKSVPVTDVTIKTQSWQQPENNMIQVEFNESVFSGGNYVETKGVVVDYGGKNVKVTSITAGNESKICFYGKFPKTENAVFTVKAGSVFFKEDAAYRITADRSFVWSGSQWWGYNTIDWITADWSPEGGVQVVTTGMSDVPYGNLTLNNLIATVNGVEYSGVSAEWYPSAGKLMFNGLEGAAANGLGTVLTIKSGSGFTHDKNVYRTTEDKSFVYSGKDGSFWMYLLGEIELGGVGYNTEKRIQIKDVDFAGFTQSDVQFQQYKGIYQNGSEITPNVWYHSTVKILDLGYHGGTGAETGGFSTDYPVEIKAGSIFYEDRNAYRISKDWNAEWTGGKWNEVIRAAVEYSDANKDWSDNDTLQIRLPEYGINNPDGLIVNTDNFKAIDESGNAITGLEVKYYEKVGGVDGNNKISISGLGKHIAQAITIKGGSSVVLEYDGKRLELTITKDVTFRYDGETMRWNPITDSISSNGRFITFTDLSPSASFENELDKYLEAGFTDFNLTFDAADLAAAIVDGKLVVTDNLKTAITTLKNAGVKIYIRNQTDGGDFFRNIAGEFNEGWAEGVFGFYFNDEPTAGEFSALTTLVEFFNTNYAKSGKLFHINLFPSYADKTNFGVKRKGVTSLTTTYYSWEEYVDNYINTVLNQVKGKKTLCIDCYPFGKSTAAFDNGVYIKDLSYIANKVKTLNASGRNVTMGMCVQAFKEGTEYSLPTTYKEISFQLLTGMTVGAELFEYFGYGNAVGDGFEIYGFAGDDKAYEAVKTANERYLYLAEVLGAYEWQGLSYFAKSGSSLSKLSEETTLGSSKCGALTSFSATENTLCGYYGGEQGDGYMITNYSDPTNGSKSVVTLEFSEGSYVLVYGANGAKTIKNIVNGTVTIEIEAGEGIFAAVRGV